MGNNAPCKVVGIGSVKIRMFDGVIRTLSNVRHVPELRKNLISLGTLDANGCKYIAEGGVLKVVKGALVIMKGKKIGTLYFLQGNTVTGTTATAAASISDEDVTKLWHMRLGHMSERGMIELSKQGLLGEKKLCGLDFCEHCVYGKHKKVKFSTGKHTTKGVLDYVHSDLWGPSRMESMSGARYFLTFIDDYSRKVWVYFLKNKNDVFDVFLKWKTKLEKQTERNLKVLRTDNGLEFVEKEFRNYCEKHGIVRHRTCVGRPQQNGVAERMNRTLVERARCMLSQTGLGKSFWAEAVSTASYLVNRSPNTALNFKTPQEIWTGKPVDYSILKVFGCPAYFHVNEGKLEPRAKKCIFMGYGSGVKGYRLWCPSDRKLIISRDVVFDETVFLSPGKKFVSDDVAGTSQTSKERVEFEQPSTPQSAQVTPPNAEEGGASSQPLPPQQQQYTIARGREKRQIKPPARFVECDLVAYALAVGSQVDNEADPNTFHEAMSSTDADKWMVAMQQEMESLHKNETWVLVPAPKEKKIVGSKWVYKKKESTSDSAGVCFKARVVAQGFTQVEGIDFHDVFSPVVKHSSIRALLALVAQDDLELEQMDVKTAFLHGELEEEIYMRQPKGFEVEGKENQVCLLKKSLYGLKQSPRQWYKRFDSFMVSNQYTRSSFDSCVYYKHLNDGSFVFLLIYVDDMLIASKYKEEVDKLKNLLRGEFEMKDLGGARKILGMEISRDRCAEKLYLSQKGYIEKVLERFGMSKAKPVSTPLSPHFRLSASMSPQTVEEEQTMAHIPYTSAVGSLMYAMVCSRPDLAQAVGMVCRYMSCPGKGHWEAVKWILRYLRGTTDLCLVFGRTSHSLAGFCDSDYAGDIDHRKSTTGYVFCMGGTAISWQSSLQDVIALSTTEAEYMAITEAFREAKWLSGLIDELTIQKGVVKVHCDSQSAIHLAKNQNSFHKRTKHIDVRFHFIRDTVAKKDVILEKIATADNPADMFTKPLPQTKFRLCVNLVGLGDVLK